MSRPLYEVSSIETPEQIEVHLPLAGIGSRAMAYGIDLLWQSVPIIVAIVALSMLFPGHEDLVEKSEDGTVSFNLVIQAAISLGIFLVNFGYFALFEIIWQGQTPGKRSVGLRVVKDGGYPLDGRAALLRNLLRAVDFLPASYALGMGLIFVGRQGKRVGDYAAGTLVIRDAAPPRAQRGTLPQAAAPTGPDTTLSPAQRGTLPQAAAPTGPLPPDERRMLVSFLDRRAALEPEARDRVATALATRLAERLRRPPPDDAEAFLTELGLDLGHLQGDAHGRS